MTPKALHPQARLTIALLALYTTAEALCSLFVSVYLLRSGQGMVPVLSHQIALYVSAPLFFMVAGPIAKAGDRVWVYRIGLGLHAVYYAVLLILGEATPQYAAAVGTLYGFCSAFFWAGANTMTFEVTRDGLRERYLGVLAACNGTAQFIAPLAGAFLIGVAPTKNQGYQWVFACAVVIYCVCFTVSFWLTPDRSRNKFRVGPMLWPDRRKRDWRLVMLATITDGGGYIMFAFVLGLLVYIETQSEFSVGGYASLQAIAYVATAAVVSRVLTRPRRRWALTIGVTMLVASGLLLLPGITLPALIAFGVLRSIAEPIYGIAQTGLRFDVVAKSLDEPSQRIEFVCAWEVPLAIGRVAVLLVLLWIYWGLDGNTMALRGLLFGLCCLRLVSFSTLMRTDEIRKAGGATPS